MARFRAVIKTSFGEIQAEAESVRELETALKELEHSSMIKGMPKVRSEDENAERQLVRKAEVSGKIPPVLISRLSKMKVGDVIGAILLYETPEASRKQIIERSSQLGKPISEDWMAKNFNRDMKGILRVSRKEGKIAYYCFTDKGRLDTTSRLETLLAEQGSK